MGAGSSRLGSHPSRRRMGWRRRRGLSSFFCGTFRSQSRVKGDGDEVENNLCEAPVHPRWQQNLIIDDGLQSLSKGSLPLFCSENECSIYMSEFGASRESNSGISTEDSEESGYYRSHTKVDIGSCLSKSKELVPCQRDVDQSITDCIQKKSIDVAGNSKELQSLGSTSRSGNHKSDCILDVSGSLNVECSQICTNVLCSCSTSRHEVEHLCFQSPRSCVHNQADEILGIPGSDNSVLSLSDSLLSSKFPESHSQIEAVQPSLAVGNGVLRDASILHVEITSASSEELPCENREISNHVASQNNRRLFCDDFSRHGSQRNDGSQSQMGVFSTENTQDEESFNRRILDFGGNLFNNGTSDLGYWSIRSDNSYDQQRNSRSEIWDGLHVGLDGHTESSLCASGLHLNGTCSCESFLISEESGPRTSISRILMLAESLFEVLDEIHRQPLSLSFSMVALPAPESVVDSFPLKTCRKAAMPENGDAEQCYICLAEYEQGDKIRILPCCHEYHMQCIDKWLKEIHGICPLCRRDVCEGEGIAEGSSA